MSGRVIDTTKDVVRTPTDWPLEWRVAHVRAMRHYQNRVDELMARYRVVTR